MATVKLVGTVRQRGKSWVFDPIIPPRKPKTYKSEALAKLAQLEFNANLSEAPKGQARFVAKETLTVEQAIEKYMLVITRQPETLKLERRAFDKLYHWLYDKQVFYIDQVKALHVDLYQAELKGQYAPASVNREFQVFKPFFKMMLRWELIEKNPTAGMKGVAGKSKKKKLYSQEAFEVLLSDLMPWAQAAMKFLSQTGCRPGQVAKAEFTDINYKTKMPTFKTFSIKGGVVKEVLMPLSQAAVDLILEQRGKLSGPLIFPGPSGAKFHPRGLYTSVRRAQKRRGLEGYCPYGLRSTFGTMKVEQGVHLKVVAQLMGHQDTRTSEGYIGDVTEAQRQALQKETWAIDKLK